MLNPRAPPFEYPPPPSTLPPPSLEYFPLPPQWPPLYPPYLYPPPSSHNFFLYLALRPPPVLPSLPTQMSTLTLRELADAATQFKDQELELQPDNDSSPSRPPPPPPPPATVSHYSTKREAKPKKRSTWIPRAARKNKQTKQLGASSLEFVDDCRSQAADLRTTVMIRNIPNKFSRDMLIELLDKHCAEENKKDAGNQPSSAYDFVYLPVDFKNGCNLGYGFVNFTTAAAARRLYGSLHRHKWMIFNSSKISHVCYARIQGRRALEEHFKNSIFRCDADEYFPAVMSPPRDGCTSRPAPVPIGSRYGR